MSPFKPKVCLQATENVLSRFKVITSPSFFFNFPSRFIIHILHLLSSLLLGSSFSPHCFCVLLFLLWVLHYLFHFVSQFSILSSNLF